MEMSGARSLPLIQLDASSPRAPAARARHISTHRASDRAEDVLRSHPIVSRACETVHEYGTCDADHIQAWLRDESADW